MHVKLTDLIAPSFYSVHQAVKNNAYTHYLLGGGRGSTKSTFAGVEMILGIMQDPEANGIALRKVGLYLKESVFSQLVWVIDKLQIAHFWDIKLNPLELTYNPTGQKILFRGADDPRKLKSIKLQKGYFKYIWYEELDDFAGMEDIRIINESLLRGGDIFCVLYTYNPPKSQRNWVNAEALIERSDRLVHNSTYLDVPQHWLGAQFLIEAEHLKETRPDLYAHTYLGEVTGTGAEVFSNITLRKILKAEIEKFDKIKNGLDFGYAGDPLAFIKMHYDKTRKRLYIFDEIYQVKLGNTAAVELIKKKNPENILITADSAEPRTIAEFKRQGLKIRGAKKGPDSIDHGIKFLSEEIEEIIIDPNRCPNAAREFMGYEIELDKHGNLKGEYPDKDNHTIDAVRYGMEGEMLAKRGLRTF